MIILLHSSKTMRWSASDQPLKKPALLGRAQQLDNYLKSLSVDQLATAMKLSGPMATKTAQLIKAWNAKPGNQSLAIDTFKGDIYSGLQAQNLTKHQRDYANHSLFILSGLYGIIRPYDAVMPYRLEMAYKFPSPPFDNLYSFWGEQIARQLPTKGIIANLSSVEYSKTVLPFVENQPVISPQFFTINPKTKQPTYVTVHSKIARGAFARWLITTETDDQQGMNNFDLLGYRNDAALSLVNQPAFVTKDFGGIGLSIRLSS